MKTVFLSVKPKYARAILSGDKTVEVRRRFPELDQGTTIVIYASSPERQVLGSVTLSGIERPSSVDVWDGYADVIGIDRASLDEYLDDATFAALLKVTSPVRWMRPIPLHELRSATDVEPPQSFRYLSPEQLATLSTLGAMAS
ncbi:ASCH domain protein [soil metagenome]